MPTITLRAQIKAIGRVHINPSFVAAVDFPRLVSQLAEIAFVGQWQEHSSTRAIRKAYDLLSAQGFVSETEPAVS